MISFNSIAVLGLGLLGGSMCKAIKKYNPGVIVRAWNRDSGKVQKALEEGVVDEALKRAEDAVEDSDCIIIAAPVGPSIDILKNLLDSSVGRKHHVITDVCSVKAPLVNISKNHPQGYRFIGSHPMAGSEKTGFVHSFEDIFRDATVLITPVEANLSEDIAGIKSLWNMVGAQYLQIDADIHDTIVAASSHVPHIVSALLVELLSDLTGSAHQRENGHFFVGNGFRDMTRIADGSPSLWSGIIQDNDVSIVSSLESLKISIEKMIESIKTGKNNQIEETLANAQRNRRDFIK